MISEELIKRNMSAIKRQCRYTAFKYHVDYSDLLGSVLEKIWRYKENFEKLSDDEDDDFRKWIGWIASRKSIDELRKGKCDPLKGSVEPEWVTKSTSNQHLESKDYLNYVGEYIKTKWSHSSEVMALLAVGYKMREISEILNIPENTIKTRIMRIRDDLQKVKWNG